MGAFNRYIWENYLKSGGSQVVDMFYKNLSVRYTDDYASQICRLVACYCPSKRNLDELNGQLQRLYKEIDGFDNSINSSAYQSTGTNTTFDSEEIDRFIDGFFEEERDTLCAIIKEEIDIEPNAQKVFELFIYDISGNTTCYFMDFPDYFIPYYFQFNFNVLQMIADQFEIELPTIPSKKDYKGRFLYYGEICKILTHFRIQNSLNPYELCAFLYDFAPKYIGGISSYIIEDLPEPRGAFLIGASKKDPYLCYNPDTITIWQCNEDTRAGDMIVMYLKTPISAIDSVWRACSIGFIDPFFYYYRCTYIGRPRKINSITQNMLKVDTITGKMPIVRKNMQGIDGVELLPSEYNHLMDMAGANLFRFKHEESVNEGDFTCEKDVEEKLIKPLLTRLGYDERDYTQQLYIEIGNHNHALIPDFVLIPRRIAGHSSAFAIIEAKKTIQNQKELEAAKIQARSYSNLLKAKYCAIISQEKIWITAREDDYSSNIFTVSWKEINDPDLFSCLRRIIGKPAKT